MNELGYYNAGIDDYEALIVHVDMNELGRRPETSQVVEPIRLDSSSSDIFLQRMFLDTTEKTRKAPS